MTELISSVLGTLVQNQEIADWWHSSPIQIPLLDLELGITFVELDPTIDSSFLDEADAALKNFLALHAIDKLKIAPHIFANFVDVCSYLEEENIPPNMRGVQPLSIWNFVHPTAIFLSRRQKNDKDIYIVLTCECDWETEHGLQMVFRRGKKLTRVSDQDGHLTNADAFGFPDDQDEMLAAFNAAI